MSITNPTELVEKFKTSGEFDRLRRELLEHFRQSEGIGAFIARVEGIALERLNSDPKIQYMSPEVVHRELMQDMDRFPVVERAMADMRMLSDPAFASNIRDTMRQILRGDRNDSSQEGIRDETTSTATAQEAPRLSPVASPAPATPTPTAST